VTTPVRGAGPSKGFTAGPGARSGGSGGVGRGRKPPNRRRAGFASGRSACPASGSFRRGRGGGRPAAAAPVASRGRPPSRRGLSRRPPETTNIDIPFSVINGPRARVVTYFCYDQEFVSLDRVTLKFGLRCLLAKSNADGKVRAVEDNPNG